MLYVQYLVKTLVGSMREYLLLREIGSIVCLNAIIFMHFTVTLLLQVAYTLYRNPTQRSSTAMDAATSSQIEKEDSSCINHQKVRGNLDMRKHGTNVVKILLEEK